MLAALRPVILPTTTTKVAAVLQTKSCWLQHFQGLKLPHILLIGKVQLANNLLVLDKVRHKDAIHKHLLSRIPNGNQNLGRMDFLHWLPSQARLRKRMSDAFVNGVKCLKLHCARAWAMGNLNDRHPARTHCRSSLLGSSLLDSTSRP